MILSCFKFIRQWKIQTQIFFFQLLIITFIAVAIGIVIQINLNQLGGLLNEIQNKLLEDMQLQRLKQQSDSINQYSQQYLEYGFEQLERINQLYQFSQKPINLTFFDASFSCPINVEKSFSLEYLPYFCYAYQNSTNPFELSNDVGNKSLIHFVDVLNIILLRGGSSNYSAGTYFAHINTTQFFSMSPVKEYQPLYRPHDRPWFKNHIEQMNITQKPYQISNFYKDYISGIQQITITRSLEDLNGNFQGVIGTDFSAEQMYLFHQNNALTVDHDGQVLWQNNQSELNYSIYDKEFTGFSMEDWEEIKNQANSKNGISNCQIHLTSFCRYNSFYNRDLILDVFNLFDKFYLIIYVDVEYLQENQIFISQLEVQFRDNLVKHMAFYVVFSVILLGVTWLLIKAFLNPYSQLNEQTLESLFLKETPQQSRKTKDVYKKINLQKFQSKMLKMKTTRSQECQILEKFKFPKQSVEIHKSIQNEITKLSNIPESQNQAQFLLLYRKIMKQFEKKEDIILDQELKEKVNFWREEIS